MAPADAPALEHRARSRRWRRRLLAWAVLAVPAVWSLLALVHAYAMCAMGWQALSAPTRERFALYVGLDPAGNVVVEDPFPDRVPPFDPLFEPGLDHSRAIVLVIYEAVAEVPRMRPDRTDLYRAVIRLESQPSPETVVILGPEGERTLDAVQADGRVFISSTRLGGRHTLRLAVLHFRTHLDEVELAIELLEHHARQLRVC